MKKLRVAGQTIEATKTYSGVEVLRLLEVSFENGRRSAAVNSTDEFSQGYEAGYAAGFAAGKLNANENLKKLREAICYLLN